MERLRLFLFATLALLGLLLWQQWQQDYAPQSPQVADTAVPPPGPDIAAPTDSGAPAQPTPPSARPEPASVQAQTIRVQTDLLDVEISTRGGEIRSVRLRQYSVSADDPTPFTLMYSEGSNSFVAQSGLLSRTSPAPGIDAVYQTEQTEYVLADGEERIEVPLTWTSESGVTVTKRFVFTRNDYVIGLEHQIDNAGGDPWRGYQFVQLSRTATSGGSGMFFANTYTGGVLHSPDDPYEKLSFEDLTGRKLERNITGGWLAMIQHYFLAAWIPPTEDDYIYYSSATTNNQAVLGASSGWLTVAPGQSGSIESRFYIGPKEQERLALVAEDLELTVDYGMLTIIAKPLFWLLKTIHSLIGNWGWSIILLTLLIKLVFYKLSETSYRSMARMRTLQPKMQALKERYGDDRQRMNQELMELYRREKINPLGGCLPILVQIPVFIALYWMLLESVELRQAPWILWIQDLSERDPYFVLPIIMGASMLIQQRLNPAPMDPVQQRVLMIMPIVFTVFFLFFPAGLVLYWVTNNLLSIAQQWVITRRIAGETTK